MVDFGLPVRFNYETGADGILYWNSTWTAFNNDSSSIAYYDPDLLLMMANRFAVVDHIRLSHYTQGAATLQLAIYGHSIKEILNVWYYITTAGVVEIAEIYGPFRPLHLPTSGTSVKAAVLAVIAGGNAADDYTLTMFGRGMPKLTAMIDESEPQPVYLDGIRSLRRRF